MLVNIEYEALFDGLAHGTEMAGAGLAVLSSDGEHFQGFGFGGGGKGEETEILLRAAGLQDFLHRPLANCGLRPRSRRSCGPVGPPFFR